LSRAIPWCALAFLRLQLESNALIGSFLPTDVGHIPPVSAFWRAFIIGKSSDGVASVEEHGRQFRNLVRYFVICRLPPYPKLDRVNASKSSGSRRENQFNCALSR
jgi:hypothetical protein